MDKHGLETSLTRTFGLCEGILSRSLNFKISCEGSDSFSFRVRVRGTVCILSKSVLTEIDAPDCVSVCVSHSSSLLLLLLTLNRIPGPVL